MSASHDHPEVKKPAETPAGAALVLALDEPSLVAIWKHLLGHGYAQEDLLTAVGATAPKAGAHGGADPGSDALKAIATKYAGSPAARQAQKGIDDNKVEEALKALAAKFVGTDIANMANAGLKH